MRTTFWLTITKTTQQARPLLCNLSLFDRPPTAGVGPIHQLMRPNHSEFSAQARNQVATSPDALQTYGNALAQWLFGGEDQAGSLNVIGEHLQKAAGRVSESQRVRLIVCVEPNLFKMIEFLGNGFLQSLSANTILPLEAVRSVVGEDGTARVAMAPLKPPVADQLRVLVVLSNPDERPENRDDKYPHLPSLEEDFARLIASLTPLQKHDAIVLADLRQPSGEMLEAKLREVNPHVFVFLGHGYHDADESGLICVEHGLAQRWSYDRLQYAHKAISGGDDLRLVVLVACRSFIAAPGLLARGIPAVMGMQKYRSHDFPSAGVVPFAAPFFTALSDFAPVTLAFAKGVEGLRDTAWREETLKLLRQEAQIHEEKWFKEKEEHLKVAAVMPTLWLAGEEDQLFAESEKRMRASYRTALRNKLGTCEWSGRPAHLPLMSIFVPPPLQEASTGQPIELDKTLLQNKALVLQGPEQSGKTTVAHWWVLRTFEQDLRTPIFVKLRELERHKQSLDQWLSVACCYWLGLYSAEAVASLLMEDCRKGKAVLVIDDVEHHWLAQPPSVLRSRLFGDQGADSTIPLFVTSKAWAQPCHPEWACLRIQSLSSEQQHTVAQRYGTVLDLEPATRDFLRRIAKASEQPDGVTPLAGRSGFWAEMLAHFLRQMVMLTDESDLLDRLQQNRWRKPVESAQMVHPDEPIYKQRMLDALGFHLYFCRRGAPGGKNGEPVMQTILRSVLQQMDLGEGPIYSPDLAVQLLQEHVEIRLLLQRTASAGWAFRSAEWRRFYAASQLAALVNDQDPAVLAWIEDGKSLHCQSCQINSCPTNLGTFKDWVAPEWVDRVIAGLAAVRAEELPAWKRTDPWDCPAVKNLRRILVRALPLTPG